MIVDQNISMAGSFAEEEEFCSKLSEDKYQLLIRSKEVAIRREQNRILLLGMEVAIRSREVDATRTLEEKPQYCLLVD